MGKEKALLAERIEKTGCPIKPFDEMARTAFDFIMNPYKVWATGLADRRAFLQLVFKEPLA